MPLTDPAALRLAALVESSNDAIISHTLDGIVETWNRAAERMFGYAAAEIIGQSIELIVAHENRSEESKALARVRLGESVVPFETVGSARNGTTLPISVSVSAVRAPNGQIVGVSRVARDLTGQKELERQALRLAAIVDSSDDAIVSKDLNGVVQTWNK